MIKYIDLSCQEENLPWIKAFGRPGGKKALFIPIGLES